MSSHVDNTGSMQNRKFESRLNGLLQRRTDLLGPHVWLHCDLKEIHLELAVVLNEEAPLKLVQDAMAIVRP